MALAFTEYIKVYNELYFINHNYYIPINIYYTVIKILLYIYKLCENIIFSALFLSKDKVAISIHGRELHDIIQKDFQRHNFQLK